MTDPESTTGIDLAAGVAISAIPDKGMVQGKLNGEDVILARSGNEFFGATCPHYGGPLVQGLITGDEIRCPLHHACFSLRTGELLRAPAFDSIPCWRVERSRGRLFVREKLAPRARGSSAGVTQQPRSIVIVGGGGAGLAAADTLRRAGYEGSLTIISADAFAPCDRPNLSKDYLAGTAADDWIPLRPPEYYSNNHIDLLLSSRVTSLDPHQQQVRLESGQIYGYDRLLLATGADPVRLPIQGAADSQLFYLRSYADSRALIAAAGSARRVVIVGGSFIGLEAAASLRERGLEVHVVASGKQPLERVMGPEVGRFVRSLHEAHGVTFHMEDTVVRLDGGKATLKSGATLDADFLVLGVGVRPSVALAEQAGLKVDRGVVVNEYLETSAPGVFAAGDIARWPDPHSGGSLRVEHWVVAERQGQVAARNMLGQKDKFAAVPFFWTQQYGVAIKYVGHAESWDKIEIDGSLDGKDCAVTYQQSGRTLAVVTVSRDLRNLQIEAQLEAAARGS
jgi:NADPH-dependent 2,4-dienoyl-CoA reductase/sulfur reductase-like enzyme/nitrite reductase/ring-hydroxylating ferredoxin subunit